MALGTHKQSGIVLATISQMGKSHCSQRIRQNIQRWKKISPKLNDILVLPEKAQKQDPQVSNYFQDT